MLLTELLHNLMNVAHPLHRVQNEHEDFPLTLPDLSLLPPTTLYGVGEGSQCPPPLNHEPFALRTSNLLGC